MPTKSAPEMFNPNTSDSGDTLGFPQIPNVASVDDYARAFMTVSPTRFEQWCEDNAQQIKAQKSTGESSIQKALSMPPEMQSFARIALLPEQWNSGVLQWPGIPPEALRKIVRENLAPQTIINMRTDDVLRYCDHSSHPWKPGWRIKLRTDFDEPDSATKSDIKDATAFMEGCNIEKLPARERDARHYQDLPTFLAELTRDSLTYDGMAVWTDIDLKGRVKAFKTLSAFNIRLCTSMGYMGDPEIFAVGVDEANNVIHQFTRNNLIFRRRNPRADPDIGGYGYPEVEQAVRLIQGFQNAMDMNADVFSKNSMPNGFLLAKGMGNQKQLDILSRIWINLKRGITKQWAIPVIPVPKDGDIEVRDLSNLKGMDVYYENYMNMVAGLFCAIFRFPVSRLGYRISGKGKDTQPETPATAAPGIDDYDPYMTVILQHEEHLINSYLMWTRWPHLQFEFCGKSPKEDAREYEARILACTVNERRALSDQPKLEDMEGDEKQKEMARIIGGAPVDPALAGVYQAGVAAIYGKDADEAGGDGAGPEARMSSKKDPARSEEHGHMSGVRRDSAAESSKT